MKRDAAPHTYAMQKQDLKIGQLLGFFTFPWFLCTQGCKWVGDTNVMQVSGLGKNVYAGRREPSGDTSGHSH
jgi:hypothetical protein